MQALRQQLFTERRQKQGRCEDVREGNSEELSVTSASEAIQGMTQYSITRDKAGNPLNQLLPNTGR